MQEIYPIAATNYINGIQDSFIFGVLAFAGIFIFLFFIITREKVYLYFSLYLLSLGIGRFKVHNEMLDVFFREFPSLHAYVYPLVWFFPIYFLVHFIRYLLHTKLHLPRWDKFLIGLNFIYALNYLAVWISTLSGAPNYSIYSGTNYEQWFLNISVLATFLLSLKWFKTNKILTWIILPLQCIWSICQLPSSANCKAKKSCINSSQNFC